MGSPDDKEKQIYLVDDHPVVQAALAGVVAGMAGCAIAGSAGSPSQAVPEIDERRPDLIVTDFNMGGEDGFDFIYLLKQKFPHIPILLFTVCDQARIGARAKREGVNGFLPKGASISEIREALNTVLGGGEWFPPSELVNHEESPELSLSRREFQIFLKIGQGQTIKEVASDLGISAKTAENHRENIKRKTNCRSALQLQMKARDYVTMLTEGSSGSEEKSESEGPSGSA